MAPPLAAPAPISVWISSTKSNASGSFSNCRMIALSRFSKSPRYRVPATSEPTSSE